MSNAGQDIVERLEHGASNCEDDGMADKAKTLRDAAAEITRLREIVGKLPSTADGVPIVPGMKVYSAHTRTIDTEDGAFQVGRIGDCPGHSIVPLTKEAGPLYSTREAAALAAKREEAGK